MYSIYDQYDRFFTLNHSYCVSEMKIFTDENTIPSIAPFFSHTSITIRFWKYRQELQRF